MHRQSFRLVYGLMFIILLLVPFGVYHSKVEPYVIGHLWGYHLPVGYVGLLSGIIVILYSKLALVGKLRFGSVMMLAGLSLVLTLFFFPQDRVINMLHNTSFNGNQVDIDFAIGNLVVWGLSLVSIIVGLLLDMKRKKLASSINHSNREPEKYSGPIESCDNILCR